MFTIKVQLQIRSDKNPDELLEQLIDDVFPGSMSLIGNESIINAFVDDRHPLIVELHYEMIGGMGAEMIFLQSDQWKQVHADLDDLVKRFEGVVILEKEEGWVELNQSNWNQRYPEPESA